MIKEIDEDIYERNNVLPIKTRKEIYQIQFKGVKLPEELQTLLDRLPTSYRTISNLEETHSHERIQENGNRQKGSDYTK